MDLSDPAERTACAQLLGTIFAGRRVVHGPRVLAAVLNEVQMTASHGAEASLVLATIRGAGEIPDEDAAQRRVAAAPRVRVGHRGAAPGGRAGTTPARRRRRRARRLRPGARGAVDGHAVRHRRRADPWPPGDQRPPGRLARAGGQGRRRGRLGAGRDPRTRRAGSSRSTRPILVGSRPRVLRSTAAPVSSGPATTATASTAGATSSGGSPTPPSGAARTRSSPPGATASA